VNVLFCTDGKIGRRGGVANYTQLMFAHFDRSKVVPYDWNLWTDFELPPLSEPSLSIALYRKYKIATVLLTLPRLVRRGEIDIVHLNPSLVPRAVLRDLAFARRCISSNIPFVVFFRGWNKKFENRINQQPRLARKLVDTFGRASAVMVLASEFKDKLEKWGFDKNRIIVETTTVDDRLLNSLDILSHIKNSASRDRFNILFLARIEKDKGVYDAIETYRILKSKYSFVSLTIAGDGSELHLVRDYIFRNKIEGVTILGWVDRENKRKAYLDADLYLFPTSWGEGMPNSVLEAMAFGLPIITRPVGGLADFFEDGKMGSIMQSKSPEKLASACETFIEDRVFGSIVSTYNHNYAVNRFLASRVARRIEAIYESVLTSKESRSGRSGVLLEKKAR